MITHALASAEVTRSGTTGSDGKVFYSDYRTSYGTFITNYMSDPVIVALSGTVSHFALQASSTLYLPEF